MCPPRNVKYVLSFCKLVAGLGRFVPNFAEVSKPLSDLKKKNPNCIGYCSTASLPKTKGTVNLFTHITSSGFTEAVHIEKRMPVLMHLAHVPSRGRER
ncbi:hypothetical protein JTB14_004241 [Gonioctena quinquepunctata]|nr:hypothetical protein JTB14_004241 [Gonioctena quinquepunctata]